MAVLAVAPLGGGACQENLRVDVEMQGGARPGLRTLVLRSDAPSSLPGSHRRDVEGQIVLAAVRAGVRTPEVFWPSVGLLRPGAHAWFMEFVAGEAIGRRVVESPELASAHDGLASELAVELARIHHIAPSSPGAPALPVFEPVSHALESLRALIDGIPEPRPALELLYRWLFEHRPPPGDVVLVHGDFRTGNFLVTPQGLSAVVDWEFAHYGAPEEDLAWIAVRDWRFGRIELPVGGFATRRDFYGAYEAASGRTVDPARVHYWEVFGNARWGGACVHQALRYLQGGIRDLELIAIGRRAAEMEFEALRLIDKGA